VSENLQRLCHADINLLDVGAHPVAILPFASMAICEPLRRIFSFGLVAVRREGLDGREGLGLGDLRRAFPHPPKGILHDKRFGWRSDRRIPAEQTHREGADAMKPPLSMHTAHRELDRVAQSTFPRLGANSSRASRTGGGGCLAAGPSPKITGPALMSLAGQQLHKEPPPRPSTGGDQFFLRLAVIGDRRRSYIPADILR
jgi:hypothetical protein